MSSSWFVVLLKGTALFCAGLLCAGFAVAVVLLLASRELHGNVASAFGLAETSKSIKESVRPTRHPEETGSAEATDHYAVVRRIFMCTGVAGIDGLEQLPVGARRVYTENPRLLELAFKSGQTVPRPPNLHEQAALELSRALFNQRLRLREKAESSYRLWQTTSLITIALGLITTVLVSLSTTEYGKREGHGPTTIRILAIIFPALGTAAAAVVAFYAPQAEWTQASRSQASISHLHNQIAVELWRIDCPEEGNKNSSFAKQLEAWAGRYADIQAAAMAASQSNSANGSNAQGPGKLPGS